jgi:L-fuconolactonase
MTGEMGRLRRNFLIPELLEVMHDSGVEATVAVQARQKTEETAWLLDLAERNPFILGVVGWVPLTDPAVDGLLEKFARSPRLKAVRHVLHDEPDDFYMLRDDFNRGVSLLRNYDLAYDILVFERHLPQTLTFVDSHPSQIFVVDHIAKPRIKDKVTSPWRENMSQLAKRENVYCKVSGMATEADWNTWTTDDVKPYFDVVLSAFGPKRLMFGSDWPVLTLAGGYKRWMAAFRSLIGELSAQEQSSICEGTAIAAYKLQRTTTDLVRERSELGASAPGKAETRNQGLN